MHVLLITGSYPPMKCGVGAYTQRLARALSDLKQIQVTVLTDERASKAAEIDGVRALPVVKGWRIAELIRIAQYIKQLKPDVIHIQYPTQGYSGKGSALLPLLIRFLGKPCVQTWHEPILGWSGLLLAMGLDMLVTVREELKANLPRLTRKALCGVNSAWIPAASILPTVTMTDKERSDVRHRFDSGHDVLLTYYGFIAPLKGIEVLFEIVAKINAKLVMVCDINPDDSYHKALLDQIIAMGIEARITITGFLPDEQLASILAASDAVVLPFRDGAGSWNTTINGAVSQGTFVLTTSLQTHGYNKDKNMYFSKPGDVEDMIDSIQRYAGLRVLCTSPVLDWRRIAEQHLNIYKQTIIQ